MLHNGPPNVFERLEEVLSIVRGKRLGLLLDFDGTLSDIAPTPEQAVIHPETVKPLESLAKKLPVVAVVSGRAADVIQDKVGIESVVFVGNHGAESIVDGQHTYEAGAAEYRNELKAAFDYLREAADSPCLLWEDKILSASIHYRLAPDVTEAENRLREALPSAPHVDDLDIFWGRMILEMRAPTGINKGYALEKLVERRNLDTIIFVGDDTTDLDAMLKLNDMREQGRLSGFNLLVLHENSTKALIDAADYSLDSVGEVSRFLRWLDEADI